MHSWNQKLKKSLKPRPTLHFSPISVVRKSGWCLEHWLRMLQHANFGWLLVGTVLLMLTFPLLQGSSQWPQLLRGLVVLAIFLPSIYAHRRNVTLITISFSLFLVSSGTLAWQVIAWSKLSEAWHGAAEAAYFLFLSVILLRYAMAQKVVNRNVVYAALVVYIMLALVWTYLYFLLESLFPGSFVNLTTQPVEFDVPVAFFYFSVMTLTTVGFGDITPSTPLAQMLVVTEALLGQMYLVATVATIVGLRATNLAESRRREHDHK